MTLEFRLEHEKKPQGPRVQWQAKGTATAKCWAGEESSSAAGPGSVIGAHSERTAEDFKVGKVKSGHCGWLGRRPVT